MKAGGWVAAIILALTGCDAPGENSNRDDLERLQGTWAAVIYQDLNKSIGGDEARLKLTITGDRFAVTLDGKVKAQGTLRIDAAKSPRTIDFIDDEHVGTGIYQLYGNDLRICYDALGTVRPSRFEVTPQGAIHLLILTREKL
jgi:uncharacterized protein (TIGR03067 family)